MASLDAGVFDTFIPLDGMIMKVCQGRLGLIWMDHMEPCQPHKVTVLQCLKSWLALRFKPGPYAPQSYDAAALMILAMQASVQLTANV